MDKQQSIETMARAKTFLDKYADFLGQLKDRWADEQEYEDWKDYEKLIRHTITDYPIKKVVKVGLVYTDVSGLDVKVTVNSSNISYKVLKPKIKKT